MRPQTILISLAIGAALLVSAPAQADGFNIGSFMFGNGGNAWLPKCTAPERLAELKDRNGKSTWRCVKPASASNTQSEMRSASAAPR